MSSINYTTSLDSSKLEIADGDLKTVGELKQHIIQKYNAQGAVLFKGSKFRIPIQDSENLHQFTLKPMRIPTVFHAELIV